MVKAWSVQCTVAGSVSENPAGAGSHRPSSRPPGHVSPAPPPSLDTRPSALPSQRIIYKGNKTLAGDPIPICTRHAT